MKLSWVNTDDTNFNEPNGLCYIQQQNVLLVADTNNHRIIKIDLKNFQTSNFNLINLDIPMVALNIDKSNIDKPMAANNNVITFNQELLKLTETSKIILTFNFCNEYSAHSDSKHKIKAFSKHSFIEIEPNSLITNETENIKFKLKYSPITGNDNIQSTNISFECNLNLCHTRKNYCKLLKIIINQPIFIGNEQESNQCKHIKINV